LFINGAGVAQITQAGQLCASYLAAVDTRKHARVVRAADETIDAALWGREEETKSEAKYNGKRSRYAARAGHSHG